MEPWQEALIGSMGGGLVLATLAVTMGMRRMEQLQGVRFTAAQKRKAWIIIFAVFSAFGFFVMSLVRAQA